MIKFYNNSYKGFLLFFLSLMLSQFNDLLAKYLVIDLPAAQITFLRFLFATLILLPFKNYLKLYTGSNVTYKLPIHFMRSILLTSGMYLWCYGLKFVPLAHATTINFTIPIFTLLFTIIFLNEKVSYDRLLATIAGFIGVLIITNPINHNFQIQGITLLLSAAIFALLDVINKFYAKKEPIWQMIFFGSLFTTIISFIPAILVWQPLTTYNIFTSFLLGMGANALIYFLLKALTLIDVSQLAPIRYIELLLSILLGYLFFNEIPEASVWVGSLVIIPATIFISTYTFNKKEINNSKDSAAV